jgi:hypothetical protein
MRIAILLLVAACSSSREPTAPSPGSSPKDAAVGPPARWIDKAWLGPPIINAGPQITLCRDGRYRKTAPFHAPPNVSGMSVSQEGMACCHESERGTYELDRDPSGAIVAVRFAPTMKHDGTTAPYVSPITAGDHLEAYRADTSPRPCDF